MSRRLLHAILWFWLLSCLFPRFFWKSSLVVAPLLFERKGHGRNRNMVL
jgi:hypothetical protein